MAKAIVYFNEDNTMAAISWGRRPQDFPLSAINPALEKLYYNVNPYFYAIYNGDLELGLLVAEGMEFEPGDMGDMEMRTIFDGIIEQNTQGLAGSPALTVEV